RIYSSPTPLLFLSRSICPPRLPTLSLHDALPISRARSCARRAGDHSRGSGRVPRRRDASSRSRHADRRTADRGSPVTRPEGDGRSEEHTSELQSHLNLVCRLLLEKKKKMTTHT